MPFAPIAIIGTGCVLPGALSRGALWRLLREGRSAIGPAPAGLWGLAADADREALAREVASDAGGRVTGFEQAFSPEGFCVPVDRSLDPVFLWPLHAAREALREAGRDVFRKKVRGAFVLGNLSYPTPGLIRYAIDVWDKRAPSVDPRNRFMSGLPAALAARAIGFEGPAFALDAACASSLYAIKLACDRLADGSVDLAIAGGVSAADDLFLHLGFTALAAMSPSGRSRPFHRAADGLVPALGAAMVLLKRLEDAVADGDRVLGVIRGVGLSNDGRSRGLLVPSEAGQVRAMRAAYDAAGLAPETVSLMECHATGTAVGDAVEARSLAAVFAGSRDLPIGSLKSNLGHLITAAGAAGLLKVLSALEAGERPATLGADEPLGELAGGPLRVLEAAEPWPSEGPRRAAVSAFGFGGNNAHLVVEEWAAKAPQALKALKTRREREVLQPEIAVIALEARAGSAADTARFEAALAEGRSLVEGGEARAADFELDLAGVRFPPADLLAALPQQTWLFDAVRFLVQRCGLGDRLPRERTAILVGMQCDAEVARGNLRFRRTDADGGRAFGGPLTAPTVIGGMPNVVANRLGQQLGLEAPGFTVSAEEASGTVALEVAARMLAEGEIDAAIAAAVDLSCEPVQAAAARAALPSHRGPPGDACVALVLKRLADARRDGDPILAILGGPGEGQSTVALDDDSTELGARFGHAHAASGLLHVAAAIAACRGGRSTAAMVRVRATGGTETATLVRPGVPLGAAAAERPQEARRAHRLRLPAHLPPVQLCAAEAPVEVMPPPPPLPPARSSAGPPLAPVERIEDAVGSAAAPTSGNAELALAPVERLEGAAADDRGCAAGALASHHRALADLHIAFVRRQTELHTRFLRAVLAPLGAGAPMPAKAPVDPRHPPPSAAAANALRPDLLGVAAEHVDGGRHPLWGHPRPIRQKRLFPWKTPRRFPGRS